MIWRICLWSILLLGSSLLAQEVDPALQRLKLRMDSISGFQARVRMEVDISFVDGTEKAAEKIVLVDPEGYVYEELRRGQLRIREAEVSLWFFDQALNKYVLWPAGLYDQTNPQITNETGQYSFLVPEGMYYLKVVHPDYEPYQSEPFSVREGAPVHFNVRMELRNFWQRSF